MTLHTQARMIDLADGAVLCSPNLHGAAAKAVDVLVEEIAKRTGIELPRLHAPGEGGGALIVAGTWPEARGLYPLAPDVLDDAAQLQAEGYVVHVAAGGAGERPLVAIIGADARGLLYGVGKLLRAARLRQRVIQAEAGARWRSAPRYPVRGHQLGYRPKTNAYDAWTAGQFDQYIRELALFGANSIEILPPRTDDDATGPLMKLDAMEMMIRLSDIIDSYGLDVWIWYPNMADDYNDPAVRQAEIEERTAIFAKLKRIDVVMIPGSDPGGMEPDPLFDWSADVSRLLRGYHPSASIWLAPQVMKYDSRPWLEAFYRRVGEEPDWLGGVVFGPHVDETLPELRRRVPQRYPICRYEDITHNYHCQYPVAEWDIAFAMTIGREGCNPRPKAHKHIHNALAPYAVGNISYSEGINDDVNKFIWSDQDWCPDTPVMDTLRDFARLFIDSDMADDIAHGLLALERNWEGPLLVNEQVDATLTRWMRMEHSCSPAVRGNYRFQMGLIRAYYDAYTKRRLLYETELEARAKDALRFATVTGSQNALDKAEAALALARTEPVAQDYKRRCLELADELFANIGYQLTVERHKAIAVDRGAFIDTIDSPLNDSGWLLAQCRLIRGVDGEPQRLAAIERALRRADPGPGGYYHNLGSFGYGEREGVHPGEGWTNDPGYMQSPRHAPAFYLLSMTEEEQLEYGGIPLAWVKHLNAVNDTPIRVTYRDLLPGAAYTAKVVYVGDIADKEHPRDMWARCTANGHVLHDAVAVRGNGVTVQETAIPPEALASGSGELTLEFRRVKGFKRLNIAEIWLTRM